MLKEERSDFGTAGLEKIMGCSVMGVRVFGPFLFNY
jgi:hypothetical protein